MGDDQRAVKGWLRRALSMPHLGVLMTLAAEGPISMGRIAQSLDVSVASATGIIDRMEQRGYVLRQRSPDDQRVVMVRRTESGDAVLADLRERRAQFFERVLGDMKDDDLRALLQGLRALHVARERYLAVHADDHEPRPDPRPTPHESTKGHPA